MTATEFRYLEHRRRRHIGPLVLAWVLVAVTVSAVVRSRDGSLDLVPGERLDWFLTTLLVTSVPLWLTVSSDHLPAGWVADRGLAVGRDHLVVDEVTFAFDELAPEVLGLPTTADEVPLAAGGSVPIESRDLPAFTQALREAYAGWTRRPRATPPQEGSPRPPEAGSAVP
ncbi:MAG: hypothetical protein ACRCZP_08405 [Phycicoccus sp.]